MNRELRARVEAADLKLEKSKGTLERVTISLNSEIDKFGVYRRTVLKNTLGRFKADMEVLGKKVKRGAYSIPYELEMSKLAEITLNEVNFTSDQKWQIANHVGKATIAGTNKVLEMIAKRKSLNLNLNKNTSGNSGIWWLDMLQAAIGVASAVAEKKAQEETEVQRYEAETDVLCQQVDARVEFCCQISKRIEELISVTDKLKERCVAALVNLETMLDDFSVENPVHLNCIQRVQILIKGISELAKVEILDSNDKLSMSDQQYIIKSRQLLTESL